MTEQQAIKHLNASGIFAYWYRSAAITALVRIPSIEAALALANALQSNHPNTPLIINRLKRIKPDRNGEQIEVLWRALVAFPTPALASVLKKLGWPTGRHVDKRLAQAVLALASNGSGPEILEAIICFARELPKVDETINDSLYTAWICTESKELEHIIGVDQRQPGEPALEALHALVTGQLARYIALGDQNGEILTQAVRYAPVAFLDRIVSTVVTSADPLLRNRYCRALSYTKINSAQYLAHLQLIGDEFGLFAYIPKLRLGQVLELCEHWSTRSNWNQQYHNAALTQALIAYTNLKAIPQQAAPLLPDGLVDIFSYWRSTSIDRAVNSSDDPVAYVHNLYLHPGQKIDINSCHWLERLIANLIDVTKLIDNKEDPVYWVSACANDVALLQTNIAGSPNEYLRHKQLLRQSHESMPARTVWLLAILCIFQEVFVGTDIVIKTLREPVERNAIIVE